MNDKLISEGQLSIDEKKVVDEYFSYAKTSDTYYCRICRGKFKMLGPHFYTHAKKHIDAGKKPKTGWSRQNANPADRKTLSADIIKRMVESGVFGKDFTYEKFTEFYGDNKVGIGAINRFYRFSKPLETRDLEILEMYLDEKSNHSLENIGTKFNIEPLSISTLAPRLALRIIHKYPDSLQKALTDAKVQKKD